MCASHEVSPEMREYERTVTTVVNAALRPVCRPYLEGLADTAEHVVVMTSAGGLLDVERGAELPAALLLSGPAAGARAAAEVAHACGFADAVSFDMGGTSTDVCLIVDGAPAVTAEHTVAGFPVRLPSVDIHTIGAGGGSIARIDPGGALVVGPASAGADPGPACYGRGGEQPTVTDANLALGRIPADSSFGAAGTTLDVAAAQRALAHAGVDADGVVAVVNAGMEQALRQVSVVRGVDPARLALVAFGGAGPLHACALAEAMGMATVIVPAAAGVLSAAGLLISPRHRELVRSWPSGADLDGLDQALATLAAAARGALGVEPCTVTTAVDCRYAGQSHDLRVPSVDEFAVSHERVNGYRRADPVEVTALRAVAAAPAPCTLAEVLAGWEGRWPEPVVGPTVEVREDCTIWVPAGWTGREGPLGSLVLERDGAMSLDPAALQVLIARLSGVAAETGAVLQRAAFSPNIKERADCSAAVFDPSGRLLAQAEHIPVHLGSMPASVAAVIARFDGGGDPLAPGEQAVVNDPYEGGTHLNDVTVVAPCHVDGRLIGWVANRAHHADLGGAAPGSLPADATDIAQEGLRIPPVRLTREVRELIVASSRTPRERAGDLDAQVGANVVGVRRLAALGGEPFGEVLDYGERRCARGAGRRWATVSGRPPTSWTPPVHDRISSTRR